MTPRINKFSFIEGRFLLSLNNGFEGIAEGNLQVLRG
jgi:hypothetical protein